MGEGGEGGARVGCAGVGAGGRGLGVGVGPRGGRAEEHDTRPGDARPGPGAGRLARVRSREV